MRRIGLLSDCVGVRQVTEICRFAEAQDNQLLQAADDWKLELEGFNMCFVCPSSTKQLSLHIAINVSKTL